MKKYFFLAAMASVALASCTNDVPDASVNEQKEINFAAPVVGANSRSATSPEVGAIEGVKYPENENFTVYAMWSPNTYATWADSQNKLYMDRVECKRVDVTPANDYWAPEAKYYWPKNGKLTFAAYSPAVAHKESPYQGEGTFNYAEDGLTIENYRVYEDASKHYDLLYSTRSYNRVDNNETESVSDYDGVDLNFKHALSLIQFKVKTAATYSNNTITLTSIKVLNACAVGKFKENITDGASYNANPQWTELTDRFTTGYEAVVANQEVNNTATAISSYNDIIVLPQTLAASPIADSPKIQVQYNLTNPQSVTIPITLVINLADTNNDGTADYLQAGSVYVTEWEIGKKYTYTITIGLNEIHLAPYVTEWVTDLDGDSNADDDITVNY